ncbi:MAG: glutaredoxin family protein [Chloroflexota bacterium]|nr:glutaredoxin family protein [Chloroflexota bacterium]
MSFSPSLPTLEFYTRRDCSLCEQARDLLQQVLEDRVKRGDPVPRVREVDLGGRPELEAAYGTRIPVLAVAGQELALASSYQSIARFLDRTIGRLA